MNVLSVSYFYWRFTFRYHIQEGSKACHEGVLRSGHTVPIPHTGTKLLGRSQGGHNDTVGQDFLPAQNAASRIWSGEVAEKLLSHVLCVRCHVCISDPLSIYVDDQYVFLIIRDVDLAIQPFFRFRFKVAIFGNFPEIPKLKLSLSYGIMDGLDAMSNGCTSCWVTVPVFFVNVKLLSYNSCIF